MYSKILALTLLYSIPVAGHALIQESGHIVYNEIYKNISQEALQQCKDTELILERLALRIDKKEDKQLLSKVDVPLTKHTIIKLQGTVKSNKIKSIEALNEQEIYACSEAIHTILAHILEGYKTGFENWQNLAPSTPPAPHYQERSVPDILAVIERNTQIIKLIDKEHQTLGLTTINKTVRSINKFLKDYKIKTVTKRAAPYIALSSYALLRHSTDTIESLGITPLTNLKKVIGEYRSEDELKKDADKRAEKDAKKFNEEIIKQLGQATQNNLQQTVIQIISKAQSPRPHQPKTQGIIGGPLTAFDHLFGNKILMPLLDITAVAGTTFGLYKTVTKDLSDLGNWIGEKYDDLYSTLTKEPVFRSKPVKTAAISFEDIIGNTHAKEQLQKVVDYLKSPEKLETLNCSSDKGYLFVGATDTAKLMAYAVAGEATKILKKKDITKKCGVYEIHASALIKDAKEALKTAEKGAPCVVVIDQLDWLSKQADVKSEIWGEFTTALSSCLKSKRIIVIGLAQNSDAIPAHLKQVGRLSRTIYFKNPTLQERFTFFERALHSKCKSPENFDLNYLAGATYGCSLEQLRAVFSYALNNAQLLGEPLQQSHLEQSIDEIIRGIVNNEHLLTMHERHLLAAQYAGQAIAYKALLPELKIAKVTLLPVINEKESDHTSPGALFTYTTHDDINLESAHILTQKAISALVGIETQRVLVGEASPIHAQPAVRFAYKVAYQSALGGLKEDMLSKKAKERLLEDALVIYESYTQSARELVSQQLKSITQVAQGLEEKITLSYNDIDFLSSL